MVSPATVVATTSSASDSFLRSGKEEQPAYTGRSGSDLSRPILISVVAKKNGFACRMPLRTQAGTGCHEGGIALSKKPPEWYLSPL